MNCGQSKPQPRCVRYCPQCFGCTWWQMARCLEAGMTLCTCTYMAWHTWDKKHKNTQTSNVAPTCSGNMKVSKQDEWSWAGSGWDQEDFCRWYWKKIQFDCDSGCGRFRGNGPLFSGTACAPASTTKAKQGQCCVRLSPVQLKAFWQLMRWKWHF